MPAVNACNHGEKAAISEACFAVKRRTLLMMMKMVCLGKLREFRKIVAIGNGVIRYLLIGILVLGSEAYAVINGSDHRLMALWT